VGSVLTPEEERARTARKRGGWPALLTIGLLGAIAGVVVSRTCAPPETAVLDEEPARAVIGDDLVTRLAALGHESKEWSGRAADLPVDARAAFLMAPGADLSTPDAAALFGWVERGATLFVAPAGCPALETLLAHYVEIAPDESETSAVPGDRVVPHGGASWRYREVTAEERVEFEAPIEEVAVPGPMRVASVDRAASILFARGDLGLAAEVVHGDGNLVVLPEPGMFSDAGLSLASNAALLASLVKDWVPGGQPVWVQK
jgi:hypothetical protein